MTDPTPTDRIRVVIVDDQALMRAGFRMILETEPDIEVVGEAEDGDRALDEIHRTRPDVVLMDIRMPVLDGVEATRRLAGPGVDDPARILILTTFDLDEYVYEAMRAGASGFLLKDTPPEELVTAVRVVHGGEALLSPRITRTLIEEFARSSTPPTPADHRGLNLLTERERDVLVEMARGRSNLEIAESLFVGETTVKTHVGHIFTKLEVRDRAQAVVAAYESGLVRPGES